MTATDAVFRSRYCPTTGGNAVIRLDVLVYAYRDQHGAPLYIGQSFSIQARHHHHSARSPWFAESTGTPEVLSVHESKRAALDAEADAIRRLRPRYNIMHDRRKRVA